MKPVRAVCGALIAVCLSGYVLANGMSLSSFGAAFPNPLLQYSDDKIGPRDSIEAIVKDATADGGSVVLCRNHHCLNLATHEDMGEAQDGYYILFDKSDPDYQRKIDRYQERIRNWMSNQE